MSSLTERILEKYARKLIGRTEMEDAMKRLDKLTQKEARMAAAQNLKVTHAVDERVMAVVGQVKAIDNRVVDVDDRVQVVDDKVTEVVYGAQIHLQLILEMIVILLTDQTGSRQR
jgi:hypothetical protein